jgi:hypothetical protein
MKDTHQNRLKAISNVLSKTSLIDKWYDHPDVNTYVIWDEESPEDEYDIIIYKVPYIMLFEWLSHGEVEFIITCYYIVDDKIKDKDDDCLYKIDDILERLNKKGFEIEQAAF